MITAVPSFAMRLKSNMISSVFSASRSLVGSSASRIAGLLMSALAIATLLASPPDRLFG